MINVSIQKLIEAIEEADVFHLPDMSVGTKYLYNNLYCRLSGDEEVTLSSLDFNAFESEDIDSLNSLHTDIFEKNSYAADGIMFTLRGTAPIHKAVSYV